MRKYRSLLAWQWARRLARRVLTATDRASQPRRWVVFDQLRRAAVSIEANIVEGYALGSTPQFLRHLRIALASAAEAEVLIDHAREQRYLAEDVIVELSRLCTTTIRLLRGLIRKLEG